jgi:hypothetical protein
MKEGAHKLEQALRTLGGVASTGVVHRVGEFSPDEQRKLRLLVGQGERSGRALARRILVFGSAEDIIHRRF